VEGSAGTRQSLAVQFSESTVSFFS
jgi:hypothetical protein